MARLTLWQWVVLALPIVSVIGFLLLAASWQIHAWGLSWIWGIFTLVFVGWRWLLVQWTRPAIRQIEAVVEEVKEELEASMDRATRQITNQTTSQVAGQAELSAGSTAAQAEVALQKILKAAQNDLPIWEDWGTFWRRCQELITAIAQVYHPEVKYPLLNIYVPQAYGLIRGTMNDMDQWMQKLSPALNQVTVGQAYQAYEVYRQLEPSARKLWQVWNWTQWVLNPAAALARQASQRSGDRATQQLLVNLSQVLREATLRNLGQQSIALYSGGALPSAVFSSPAPPTLPKVKTQTLREILAQAEPVAEIEQKPVNILLVGRTGAGKSSLINTLFNTDQAAVDVLPSTERIQNYHWQVDTGESLTLWDTPGYEQINRADFREQVLDYATSADLLLLVTPALDPALQMDVDFLRELRSDLQSNFPSDSQSEGSDLPTIAIVTQVDRLRPLREWHPPYDWQWGDRAKEKSIREATQYRAELLGEFCDRVLPVVTGDRAAHRPAWNIDTLSMVLVEAIDPAKQQRLARFLRNLDARTMAAAKIIDHYTFQMTTTQGLTALLKSPVLQFISTLTTGSPSLAYVLAEQIPVEQLPIVIGKLQMAYELFSLLQQHDGGLNRVSPEQNGSRRKFDLQSLWPLLLENSAAPERNAWAFGHALVEYWTQDLTIAQLWEQFRNYLGTNP